ncbi:MAG TPA: hypothetical protein P5312_09335 [Bacteroidales bacterium]|jgi:lipoate-protein ligase A|nr:hypothetical protein [Bacteroidales bacterium]HOL98673.1 hypothetical protein [Bacteroidales bacterium]HPD25030.1 hypothetical protein [Bacteroidales bacterium]HRT00230.1 hypothetical protein [Bacteroidales bacterium]HUM33093.1 hypothetical protein [Bacteroidales bacterium]
MLKEYILPDSYLFSPGNNDICIWIPDKIYIVLGQRDLLETAVKVYNISEDIEILKRPSGGHAVVLTPKTIIVSMRITNDSFKNIKKVFIYCNEIIIEALQNQGVNDLSIKGISDICIGDYKIAGSSMYNGREYIVFHAVINVSENPDFIEELLKHPETEPEYRAKRSHKDFVSSLEKLGYKIDLEKFKTDLKRLFG